MTLQEMIAEYTTMSVTGIFILDAQFAEDIAAQGDSEYFKRFMDRNRIHYYAEPREDFSILEAIEQTKAKGFYLVCVENMG